jgi:hypothetical protein
VEKNKIGLDGPAASPLIGSVRAMNDLPSCHRFDRLSAMTLGVRLATCDMSDSQQRWSTSDRIVSARI